MQKKNLCVTVNTLCNWDCKYCISETNLSSTSQKKERSEERLFLNALETLRTLNPDHYKSITISGGEPGLLPENKIFDLLQVGYSRGFTIDINSNGKIFKSIIPYIMDYAQLPHDMISDELWYKLELIKMIDTIDLHLAPNMEEGLKMLGDTGTGFIYPNPTLPKSFFSLYSIIAIARNVDIKVRPLMVVGKSDLPYLEDFINAYNKQYIPSSTLPKLELRVCMDNESKNNSEKLSKEDIMGFMKTIYKNPGVSEESMSIAEAALESRKLNRYS